MRRCVPDRLFYGGVGAGLCFRSVRKKMGICAITTAETDRQKERTKKSLGPNNPFLCKEYAPEKRKPLPVPEFAQMCTGENHN